MTRRNLIITAAAIVTAVGACTPARAAVLSGVEVHYQPPDFRPHPDGPDLHGEVFDSRRLQARLPGACQDMGAVPVFNISEASDSACMEFAAE